ncbi:MAG: hypothetical protein KC592_10080 [Nitrospira sp.]|nr:hypothetical protein [Nitrospira sp.]MCW5785790.1 hypothetical protein [Nitrospirales bacterium]
MANNRVGGVRCEMGDFTVRDQQPADFCKQRVKACEVSVEVIGLGYTRLYGRRPSRYSWRDEE